MRNGWRNENNNLQIQNHKLSSWMTLHGILQLNVVNPVKWPKDEPFISLHLELEPANCNSPESFPCRLILLVYFEHFTVWHEMANQEEMVWCRAYGWLHQLATTHSVQRGSVIFWGSNKKLPGFYTRQIKYALYISRHLTSNYACMQKSQIGASSADSLCSENILATFWEAMKAFHLFGVSSEHP